MSIVKKVKDISADIQKVSGFGAHLCDAIAMGLYDEGYRKQSKQSEWISVDERLPEPNTHVLIYVFFHNQWQIVKGWLSFCDKKFHIANSDYPSLTDIPTTHWMPLPEAPKMKGGAE